MKVHELFSGRIFTLSNFLSIARIILVPFIGYTFYREDITGDKIYMFHTLILYFLIMATDFLDGFLARALNQVSRLGQFIDPIADKISALSLGILLCVFRDFPLWLVIIMIVRDIYVITGGFLLFSRKDIQARPNFFGKLMVCSMGLSGFVYIVNPQILFHGYSLQIISIYIILFFLISSSFIYWKTYSRIYFAKKH